MSPLFQHNRSGARSPGQNLAELALRGALPAAMVLASAVTLTLSGDRAAASEAIFLMLWSAAVFTPLAFLETASRPVHAALGLAVPALLVTLPRSAGLRPVVVAALLALSVLILGRLALARRPSPDLRTVAALALATAFVLHGHRLFLHGTTLTALVLLAILPGAAAAVGARLAAGGRPVAGFAAGFALLTFPQLAAEPWWALLAFVTAALCASFGAGAGAKLAQRSLCFWAAATLLAGSFPWLRAAPVATLLGAVSRFERQVTESPLGERVVVLTQTSPRLEVELSGAAVSSLVVDSYLTHGVELACGQELAAIELADAPPAESGRRASAKAPWHAALVAGRDSAEWAAGRPDVAARLACPAPLPWISWIPGAGRFLGQTTRARFALPLARHARRLTLERNPALPAETTLAIFFLATER